MMNKKAQLSAIQMIPLIIIIVGVTFLSMAVMAYVGMKYSEVLPNGSTAQNISGVYLQDTISNNAGMMNFVTLGGFMGAGLIIIGSVYMGFAGYGSTRNVDI